MSLFWTHGLYYECADRRDSIWILPVSYTHLDVYKRQDKPDVDEITGLSPAISIDQKTTSHNPRSTVGTVTEIYDYRRLLYARVEMCIRDRARAGGWRLSSTGCSGSPAISRRWQERRSGCGVSLSLIHI